jgi:hypothetical protein
MKRAVIIFLVLLGVGRVGAETVSGSRSSITFTFDAQTRVLAWTAWSVTGTYSGNSGGNGFVLISVNSTSVSTGTQVLNRSYSSSSNGTYTQTSTGGQFYSPVGPATGSVILPIGQTAFICAGFYRPDVGNFIDGTKLVSSDVSQTVVITPTTDTIFRDDQASFVASGGHNGYIFQASGSGGILYTGDTAIFTPSGTGTATVTVYSPAGNGYAESNYAHATITINPAPAQTYQAKITFDNRNRTHTTYFKVWQSGKVVHTETVAAGHMTVKTITLENGSSYTITWSAQKDPNGVTKDGVYTVSEEVDGGTGTPTDTSRGDQPAEHTTDTSEKDGDGKPRDLGTIYVESNKKEAPSQGVAPDPDERQSIAQGVKSKLPSMPTITGPGQSDGRYSFSMPMPGVSRSYDFTVDMSQYSTGIMIFRTLVKAVMTVYFFFLSLKAVREAAA